MSALAEQYEHYQGVRERLGMPVVQIRRIVRPRLPEPAPVVAVAPAVKVEPKRFVLPRRAHWLTIVREVAEKHGFDIRTLLQPSRQRDIVKARYEAFYRMRTEIVINNAPMSYPEIGRRFGMDHTSVLYGVNQHAALLKQGEVATFSTLNCAAHRTGTIFGDGGLYPNRTLLKPTI